MLTHRITQNYDVGNGAAISQQVAKTADAEDNRDIAVASDASDLQVNITIDKDQVAALCLLADQDMALEVNDGDAPDQTINLTADVPVVWYAGNGQTIPLDQDVTAIYVTNSSDPATAGTLKIRVLQDSTP